jgi:heptosyltransferase-2
MKKIDKEKIERIMILGAIGIGNLLLFSPALKIIRREFPNARITLIILKESFKFLYEGDNEIDEIMIVDEREYPTIIDRFKLIFELRRKRFDLSITTFPSNRFEYNLLPFLAGAKYRISHKYPLKYWRSLSFLQNVKIPVKMDIHDLDQNLNLLEPLNINTNIERRIYLNISDDNRNKASGFLKERGINENDVIIGIHPGSSIERGMIFKRWEAEKFVELGKRLIKSFGVNILIFGGEEENQLKSEIQKNIGEKTFTVAGISLKDTAGLIERCKLFITSDSGIMHIAVAMNVKTIALFGPTDSLRTSPYGGNHIVIRKILECSPCWSIRNLGVGNVNCKYFENVCMKKIEVDEVFDVVSSCIRMMKY